MSKIKTAMRKNVMRAGRSTRRTYISWGKLFVGYLVLAAIWAFMMSLLDSTGIVLPPGTIVSVELVYFMVGTVFLQRRL